MEKLEKNKIYEKKINLRTKKNKKMWQNFDKSESSMKKELKI